MKSNTLRLSHTEIVQLEADKLKLAELNGSLKEELNFARAEQVDNRIANQVEKNYQLHNFQLENIRQENNQLKSEVSILRHRLHSKSITFHDLSCSFNTDAGDLTSDSERELNTETNDKDLDEVPKEGSHAKGSF